ncbi:MAG: hypothetical protein Q9N62_06420 [Ghiorsea sp.]|nr:hypothetical protein [Ghiorsea sp.]
MQHIGTLQRMVFFGESDDSAEAKSVDNSRLSEKTWGMDLGIDAGGKAFGPLDKNTTILKSLINPSTIPTGQLTTNVGQTVAEVAAFSKGIASLDPSPMGVGAFADVGTGLRIGSYGVSIRGSLDVGGTVILDNQNSRLDVFATVAGGALDPECNTGSDSYYEWNSAAASSRGYSLFFGN